MAADRLSDTTPPRSLFSEGKPVTPRECDYWKHAEDTVQKFEIKPYTEIKGKQTMQNMADTRY
jgi:hypothetical protein